jgi:predicted anti-sigma-YlaC factor YlaD
VVVGSPSAIEVRKRPLACQEMAGELALVVDHLDHPSLALEEHLAQCLSCQAELVRYRKLLRMLADLRLQVDDLPEGMLGSILTGLSRVTERRTMREILARRPRVYLFGLGSTIFLITVLVTILRGGRRHLRPHRRGAKGSTSSEC